ncbi:hypothetical protein LRS13_23015 [Svornostia abyssi]|uniref:Uncharacterized protein n=1 Tax=Svornostia abyssi TaxID=2898438 RepID=A0ABY5PFV5_9ACTN|nr:hypothetical protein LRS13_23015 [Parviterribacteraceae bacterium J379]
MAPAAAAPEFFGPGAVFNERVDHLTALDRDSAAYAAELHRQVRAYRTTVNIRRFTVPIYRVGASQPRVRVAIDQQTAQRMQEIMSSVPLPPGARGSAGTDAAAVVYQESTDTMWEFWRLRKEDDGFHAGWGGRVVGVSETPGWFRNLTDPGTGEVMEKWHFGANATHLNLLGGVVTIPEWQSGRIDHALAIAIPEARQGVWSLPAGGTDGKITGGQAIPEGARFRLDPDLDLDRLDLPPMTRMLARAAQRHGMIVNNTAGAVAFYGEDVTRFGSASDPYVPLLGGLRPGQVAEAFPWEHVQTLPLRLTDGARTGDALRASSRRGKTKQTKQRRQTRRRSR